MNDFFEKCKAQDLAEAGRAEAWQKAVKRLSITFEADMPMGGHPEVLVAARSAEDRLSVLRSLGFRVLERWELDHSGPGCAPDLQPWVRVLGNISVSLSDGFVCRSVGVRTR